MYRLQQSWRQALAAIVLSIAIAGALSSCARTPSAQAARYVSRGEARMAQKDYARAALEFRNAVRVHPGDTEAIYNLALTHLYRGEFKEGVAGLREVLQADSGHAGAHLKLAELRAGAGMGDVGADVVELAERRMHAILEASPESPSEAVGREPIETLERAIKRTPASPELQSSLIHAYVLARRFADAERTIEEILKQNRARRQRADRVSFAKKIIVDFFNPPPGDPGTAESEQNEACEGTSDTPCDQSTHDGQDGPDIKKGHEDALPLVLRAQIYLATARAKEAEQDLIEAISKNPRLPLAHYLISKVHEVHGAAHAQQHELSHAVELAPNWLKARLELAHVLTQAEEAAAAVELLGQAPKSQQNNLDLITELNWALLALDDRIGLQRSLSRVANQNSADLLIQEGILRLRLHDEIGARRYFQLAQQIKPQDIRAADALSESYMRENKPDLALAAVREYAARYPKSGGLQYLLGTWLVRLNYPEEARSAFRAAIQATPGFLEALKRRADLDLAAGNPNAALQAIASIAASPGGESSAELAQGMLEERQGGSPESAVAHYRKALQLDPDNSVALNNLAFHLAQSPSRNDEALTLALRAKKLDPGNPAVDDTLGWAYYNNGAYPLAVRYLQEAVARDSNPARKYRLAMAYFKAGEIAKARTALRDGLKADANAPEAAAAKQMIGG